MKSQPFIGAIAVCAICASLPLLAAPAQEFPVGSYHAKDMSVVFDAKGKFSVSAGGTTEVSGTYVVQQGRVELTDVTGPWACTKAGQKKGTYIWSWNGTALTFLKVTDSCDERSQTLVPLTWQRV